MSVLKVLMLSGAVALATGFSSPAEASGYHGHGYYGGYHHRGHGYHRGYRHGYRHGYRRHHRRHNNDAAYLAGGLILGSLFTHAYYNHRDHYHGHDRYVVRGSRTIRTEPRYQTRDQGAVSRRLFRDRNGDCFERIYDASGEEVLLELDAAECNW